MNTLAFGYVIPLLGLTRDLHPLDNARAEHTIKKGTFRSECAFIYNNLRIRHIIIYKGTFRSECAFIYNNVSNTQIILHHCCDPKSR